MSSPNRSAIVIVVDRLGASWLGPYGNTRVDTPYFNQFASESFLCEQAITDSPDLHHVYDSYWTGQHACLPAGPDRAPNLLHGLSEQGIPTVLVTDDASVAEHPCAVGIQSILLEASDAVASAGSVDDTQLSRLFALATQTLGDFSTPGLVWIHSRGMAGSWDAPLPMRNSFAEEDDPTPPEFTECPSCRLPVDYDPDELLGMAHAYAGQVSLVDQSVGAFLSTLVHDENREGLTLFTSTRGFPLGEHLRVGSCDEALYSELLQVPLMFCMPQGEGAMQRTQQLVQPRDVYATLAEWFGIEAAWGQDLVPLTRGVSHPAGDRALACWGEERALRTPAWFARRPAVGNASEDPPVNHVRSEQMELYVKPDDRFEVNNVADRCPDVVQGILDAWRKFEQSLDSNEPLSSEEIPDILMQGLD